MTDFLLRERRYLRRLGERRSRLIEASPSSPALVTLSDDTAENLTLHRLPESGPELARVLRLARDERPAAVAAREAAEAERKADAAGLDALRARVTALESAQPKGAKP